MSKRLLHFSHFLGQLRDGDQIFVKKALSSLKISTDLRISSYSTPNSISKCYIDNFSMAKWWSRQPIISLIFSWRLEKCPHQLLKIFVQLILWILFFLTLFSVPQNRENLSSEVWSSLFYTELFISLLNHS